MKKPVNFLVIIAIILSLSLTSCGPGKKLLSSRARVENLQKDSINVHDQLNECNTLVKNLKYDKTSLLSEKAALQNENASVENDLKALSTQSKMTIAEQAKRLKSLQEMIQSQKDVMNNLKNSLADALMNYKSDELNILYKDGNVYVSLQEKLLFKSGSDVVDPKGKEALRFLAQVLNNTKDITVMIEGHTDNIPIKTKLVRDNWDLSTARATSIVRILTKDYGFDPGRITASGRSQFHPVKSNDTPEARAGNRRTEIILSPNMKELYNLIYQ
ncbi:MAG: OmpA family protein [Bacteroidota bacterium]|nr:flagellar motor protein MotB [Odoribacter sp.]MDP3642470.1 OmpA family protein [Bacteroidota bacterium]